MTLLNDSDLVASVTGSDPIVKDLPRPQALDGSAPNKDAPWYGPNSPIQAASIDLHIGDIFLPGAKDDVSGTVVNPLKELVLKFGHTTVMTTLETLNLPNSISALGFPPPRLSFRGLLMTNPGHVDPGYTGPLRFTVMNVGKEPICLRKGDAILTVLFFKMKSASRAGYADRKGLRGPVRGPTQAEVDALSLDFLDVSARTKIAARDAIKKFDYKIKLLGVYLPFGAALVVAFVSGWLTLLQPLNRLKEEIETIKQTLGMRDSTPDWTTWILNIKLIDSRTRAVRDTGSTITPDENASPNRGATTTPDEDKAPHGAATNSARDRVNP